MASQQQADSGGWRVAIDRGGTFTDLVAEAPDGTTVVRKVLSQQPERPGDPALRALRDGLGLSASAALRPGQVTELRLGTTVVTNALLERRVQPVLLLLNEGFTDLPWIGDQHRPDLFALHIERPDPLPLRVVSVTGRLAADGSEVQPLQLDDRLEETLRQALGELDRQGGCAGVAVALLHSCRNPDHEQALGHWLEQRLPLPVLLSHRVTRQPRLIPRLQTTVAETALRPVLHRYLDGIRRELGDGVRLRVMTSGGSLQAPELLQARDTILSGPAGGMVAAVAVAREAGLSGNAILGFDMGGTSTDVFHVEAGAADAGLERLSETNVAGLRLQAAMLPIHTVAAGGGSVLQARGGRLLVGPRSAGADPGPACYRRGGPLTITDANLLLGRLPAGALPAVFGTDGDQPPDGAIVRERFAALAAELGSDPGRPLALETVAQGALAIAIERMADAIRRISIQRGHDIREAVLVCFGGAAGQHACALAEALGLSRVLCHPLAGVLSAHGIGLARQQLRLERHLGVALEDEAVPLLRQTERELLTEAVTALERAGDAVACLPGPPGSEPSPVHQVSLELRLAGSETGLLIPWQGDSAAALREAFMTAHRQRFGYAIEAEPLVLERVVVTLSAAAARSSPTVAAPASRSGPLPPSLRLDCGDRVPLCLEERGPAPGSAALRWQRVPLWRREQLAPGQVLRGPALVLEGTATLVLERGWQAQQRPGGALLLERMPAGSAPDPADMPRHSDVPGSSGVPAEGTAAAALDPVRLELYNHRFAAIAEQMGVRLQQSSRSLNIRERLDFSCALFDGEGGLVANAPHIPVHLGSMGESVLALLSAIARGERPPLRPGDAIAANDPYHGGTHLPDITVITPVFAEPGSGSTAIQAEAVKAPLFFVASRGHHADVGGLTPGSMPAFSRTIHEEGLLLDNELLLEAGQFDAEGWRRRLAAEPFPVRNPEQLLADLQAQLAANQLGVAELQRLVRRHGLEEVRTCMGQVQANAAEAVRRVIDRLQDGSFQLERDDGSRIAVAVCIDRQARRIRIDFSGTSPQSPGNANAPLAITRAVVLYVFRCLVGEAIPLNAGCFEPIELIVPEGSLLAPRPPAAVVAGNVETSQAIANALFAALGVQAAAQGTMNNLSFGNHRCQYYETIGGGSGAGPGFPGASGVQSHMTNSRLTDPEVLEQRLPVRLERFARRRGSGGSGRWRGGEGLVRELRFLEPLEVTLLSDARRVPPFGLAGGGAGACGVNRLVKGDAREEWLGGSAQIEVQAGDLLSLQTPGGGGYGPAAPDPAEEQIAAAPNP
ncbi:MAG: hydantoinase B/oxoprolinase family protein [Synechococcaceae cyanobacterium]|nr:hydantoinase B/oxoprolinase family protein [Synechococcaceae cyanobacterium]